MLKDKAHSYLTTQPATCMVPSLSSSFNLGARSPLRTALRSLREKRWRSSVRWPGRLSNWSSTLRDTHADTHGDVCICRKYTFCTQRFWNYCETKKRARATSYSLAKRQVLKRFFMWNSCTLKTWEINLVTLTYTERNTQTYTLIHVGRNRNARFSFQLQHLCCLSVQYSVSLPAKWGGQASNLFQFYLSAKRY